jgi:hypothetical protein
LDYLIFFNKGKDDYVNNMFSSYNCDSSSMPCSSATSSACCASNSNNLYDALENFKGADPTVFIKKYFDLKKKDSFFYVVNRELNFTVVHLEKKMQATMSTISK